MARRVFLYISLLGLIFIVSAPRPVHGEILNDYEFGYIEIIDFSVIEEAAGMFLPSGLHFDSSRGATYHPGDEIGINVHGINNRYLTIIDYSPDRLVKPLVLNEYTSLGDGGLERNYWFYIGNSTGDEYVMMIVTKLPITDEELEVLALAPNEIEYDDQILRVSINDFRVVDDGYNPDRVVEWGESLHNNGSSVEMIPLEEFAEFLDYPLNTHPYNPWSYMYLYPYPRFNPVTYVNELGPLSNVWYIYPTGTTLTSNFMDYTWDGWIDNSMWIIPPGGSWSGQFYVDDPYSDYYLRILPYLIRDNTSYMDLQVEINGTLIEPSIDITGAIGWGEFWTYDPFAYYNAYDLLHNGYNDIHIYWPDYYDYDAEFQMMDVIPAEQMYPYYGTTGTGL